MVTIRSPGGDEETEATDYLTTLTMYNRRYHNG